MVNTVRIAILGGGFSAEFRTEVYQRLPGVEVTSMMTRRADAGPQRGRLGIRHTAATFEDLLAGPPFDAVDICLPNHLHKPFAILAARHGKHVICQKPLGRTADEAQEMLSAVESAGVIHCYGENWLFSPDMRELESIIRKGVIGRPLWMRGREAHGGPHSPWFYDKALSGGGAMLDMGCHVIGVMNALCGQRVAEVICHASTLYHKTDCDDNALAVLRYEGGLVGQVEASWTTWGGAMVSFEVWGDEGRATYDRSGPAQPIKVFAKKATDHYFMEKADSNRGWLFPMVEEWWRYGYYDELSHFIDAIRNRRQPRLTFREGLEVNRVVDAAYQSAAQGTWVPIP